jgi:hypothetical protein
LAPRRREDRLPRHIASEYPQYMEKVEAIVLPIKIEIFGTE